MKSVQPPTAPFLGRALLQEDSIAEDDVLALTLPVATLLEAESVTLANLGRANSPLAQNSAALLSLLCAIHDANDDRSKRILLEFVPGAADEPGVDVCQSHLQERVVLHLPPARNEEDPYCSERSIAFVRVLFVCDRSSFLPARSIGNQVDTFFRLNAQASLEHTTAQRRKQKAPRKGRSPEPSKRRSSLPHMPMQTENDLSRALALIARPGVAVSTCVTTVTSEVQVLSRLEARVRHALSLVSAVAVARDDEFGTMDSYRGPAAAGSARPKVVFPRPAMVFVLDSAEQQSRLMQIELPRPVRLDQRHVSAERAAYVESRHGVPPDVGPATFYFNTDAGRAYSQLVGWEGSDLLAHLRLSHRAISDIARANRTDLPALELVPMVLPGVLPPGDVEEEGKEETEPELNNVNAQAGNHAEKAQPARQTDLQLYLRTASQGAYSRFQAAALRRCLPLFQPAFGSHSTASRAAAAELRRYLDAHGNTLFRPCPRAFADLSIVTSWVCERSTNAETLYQVHPARRPMLMRMLLCLLNASDMDSSGKIHHLALGPQGEGKSFCMSIVGSWAVPGQAVSVSHKSSMADTAESNEDGILELWHEGNPKWFGVGRKGRAATTPEESRFKSRLTEGISTVHICVPGRVRSVQTYTRNCNGCVAMNLNGTRTHANPLHSHPYKTNKTRRHYFSGSLTSLTSLTHFTHTRARTHTYTHTHSEN
jgi:hypothetical protein